MLLKNITELINDAVIIYQTNLEFSLNNRIYTKHSNEYSRKNLDCNKQSFLIIQCNSKLAEKQKELCEGNITFE